MRMAIFVASLIALAAGAATLSGCGAATVGKCILLDSTTRHC